MRNVKRKFCNIQIKHVVKTKNVKGKFHNLQIHLFVFISHNFFTSYLQIKLKSFYDNLSKKKYRKTRQFRKSGFIPKLE